VGLREMTPHSVEQSADDRARAFTLLMRSWSQIRRAVNYLRQHQSGRQPVHGLTTRRARAAKHP